MKDRFKELVSMWPVVVTLLGVIAMGIRLQAKVEEIVHVVDSNNVKITSIADRQTEVRLTLAVMTNDVSQIKDRVHNMQNQMNKLKSELSP